MKTKKRLFSLVIKRYNISARPVNFCIVMEISMVSPDFTRTKNFTAEGAENAEKINH